MRRCHASGFLPLRLNYPSSLYGAMWRRGLPLSEPFDLPFSVLLHRSCESRVRDAPRRVRDTLTRRAGRAPLRVALAMKTTLMPHLRIAPYKESVTIVQIQMPFYVVGRSFRPSGGLYAPGNIHATVHLSCSLHIINLQSHSSLGVWLHSDNPSSQIGR